MTTDLIIKRLRLIFDTAKNASTNSQNRVNLLYNFFILSNTNKDLRETINIKQASLQDTLNNYRKAARTEIRSTYNDIKLFSTQNGIGPYKGYHPAHEDEFLAYEAGWRNMDEEPEESMHRFVCNMLDDLPKTETCMPFIKRFSVADNTACIIEYSFSPNYNLFIQEKAWLNSIYYQSPEYVRDQLSILHEHCERYGFNAVVIRNFNGLSLSKIRDFEEYIGYARILLELFEECTNRTTNNPVQSQRTRISATLSKDPNIITASAHDKEEDIVFEQYEQKKGETHEALRFKLLLILYENKDGLSRSELLKRLNATNREILTARRGINNRFQEAWGFDEYVFLAKSGKLKINDQYPTLFTRQ